jgi:hypothetical protein
MTKLRKKSDTIGDAEIWLEDLARMNLAAL